MMKIKPDPKPFETFLPKAPNLHDGHMVPAAVGSYRPNAFGLHDMHGNVCEWTRSLHRPYPYDRSDGREDPRARGKRVVRGGSWRHRPSWATSSIRWGYEPWQAPALVGFRVVCEGPLEQASSRQVNERTD
jgi:formylglycine-generating enzyme required for sulfatase activity